MSNTGYGDFYVRTNFFIKDTMYGDKGVELIKEAVRAGDSLAPFNEDAVRYTLGKKPGVYIQGAAGKFVLSDSETWNFHTTSIFEYFLMEFAQVPEEYIY
jgi:hypothetical protein